MNLWSMASIADFGFNISVFESWSHLFFFIGEIIGGTEIRTWDHEIQSKLCLPLDHGDKFFQGKNFCMQFCMVGDMTTPD